MTDNFETPSKRPVPGQNRVGKIRRIAAIGRGSGRFHLLVVVMLMVQLFLLPLSALPTVQAAARGATTDSNSNGITHTLPPLVDPHLPSLSIRAIVGPSQTLAVGDTATVSLYIQNEATDPANQAVVTMALPDGVVALPDDVGAAFKGFNNSTSGWQWTLGTVAATSSLALKANLKIVKMPYGQAFVVRPQVIAKGLSQPNSATSGALVVPTTSNLLTPTNSSFQPGQQARIVSSDGSVEVKFPKDAFDQPLNVQHRPYKEKTPQLKALNASVPTERAGYKGSFQPFFLEANTTDAKKGSVHQFKSPLTLSVHYTPQQLEALGIQEDNLTLFWWDATAEPIGSATKNGEPGPSLNKNGSQTDAEELGQAGKGRWVAVPSSVDPQTQSVTAQITHFTPWALADGSSPSSAFIPSLQGFQENLFTGGASYSYPLDIPAGPGGLKPGLNLAYSSNATDGPSGQNSNLQSGWVGKGWSLDVGMIAANTSPYNGENHPTMVLNGASYDLMQLSDQTGQSTLTYNTVDESYLKIQQQPNGLSYDNGNGTGRGGFVGTAQPRTKWQVWSKDGTLYEFAEDGWWAWLTPSWDTSTNRWFLSKVTDVHGNTINYNYGRLSYAVGSGSGHGWGDRDIWPTSITWGGNPTQGNPDRFRVDFTTSNRTNDLDINCSANQEPNSCVHNTKELDQINISSNSTGSSWDLVRQYRITYDYSLFSDYIYSSNNTFVNDTGHPKLTLKTITRLANDGSTFVPGTTFTYGAWDGQNNRLANNGYNRLIGINNGQGGTITLNYQAIGRFRESQGSPLTVQVRFRNNQRLTSRIMNDGQGHSYTYTYGYFNPAYNSLGNEPNWMQDTSALHTYPNSAVLVLAAFLQRGNRAPLNQYPIHQPNTEFRGHSQVVVTDPNGTQTTHNFIQGDVGCYPIHPGSATNEPEWGDPALYNNTCFQSILHNEMLKGKESSTIVKGPGGTTTYSQTTHNYSVNFDSYGEPGAHYNQYLGLWHNFTYEYQTDNTIYDPQNQTATQVKHSKTYYDPSYQNGGVQFGNVTKTEEYDGSWNLYRRTENYFTTVNSPTAGQPGSYMVDRKYLSKVSDGAGRPYALSFTFYDNLNTSLGGLSGKGDLTRVSKVLDLNPAVGITGQTLHTSDSTTNYYDYWGNPTSSSTYPGTGTAQYSGSAWTFSAPSGAARTTTIGYDTTFHLYPITSTPPLVNVDLSEHANYDYRMGLLTSTTDANSNVTQATYDIFGRLASLIKPGDTVSQPSLKAGYADFEVPMRYEVSQIESINGAAPVYRLSEQLYDGMGRQIQTKVESQYRVQEVVTDKVYDGLGQVIKASQPRYVSYPTGDWHTNGFKTLQPLDTDANERWTATTYDPVGRPLSVTAPDSTVSRNGYALGSHGGSLTTSTDALNHRVSRENDLWGRLGWVYEYNGTSSYTLDATTVYTYSPLDQLTTVRDNKGNQTTMTYDSAGRKTAMTDPDMGSWSYTYDPNGNLRTQTDAKNQTITFYYDALDRLGGVATNATGSAANSYTKNYAYDENFPNGKGRRTSMSNPNEYQQWWYTPRGQVSQTAYNNITGMTGTRYFNWTYDVGDNISTIKVPSLTAPSNGSATDRETVTYTYDGAGRPTGLCSSLGGCYAGNATYTALNQPLTRAEGSGGINKSWTYNGAMQRLSEAKYSGQGGTSGNLFDRTYTYDNVGNIQSIAAIGLDGLSGQTQNFRYDQRDRLSHAWTSGTNTTAAYDETDVYDELGNLTSKGGTAYSYPTGGQARPHTPTAVGGQAYSYDANGNLLTGGGRTINWDVDNKPYSIMAGAMTGWESYKYDADGERMSRTLGATTTIYLNGGMWEETLGGEVRSIISFNGQAIAQRSSIGGGSGTVTYLHTDHLGGASISTDSLGNNVQRQEFDPWGKVRSGGISSTSLNYTGQRLDSNTQLLFYNARYYDPGLGRFLSPDSVVPASTSGVGGDAGLLGVDKNSELRPLTVSFSEPNLINNIQAENSNILQKGFWFQLSDEDKQKAKSPSGPGSSQALNRYSYTLNNPILYTDATGHWYNVWSMSRTISTETQYKAAVVAIQDFLAQHGIDVQIYWQGTAGGENFSFSFGQYETAAENFLGHSGFVFFKSLLNTLAQWKAGDTIKIDASLEAGGDNDNDPRSQKLHFSFEASNSMGKRWAHEEFEQDTMWFLWFPFNDKIDHTSEGIIKLFDRIDDAT